MASRRHFRYIVRDQYGFVIQNARVYFYQPGTSTDFTGTAFDAFTGGNAVTNPFITNAQGEVEAYFTTAQDIDIFVDDNNDTAYRAVNGSGAVISFTSFTERGAVLENTADLPNEAGGSGDISAIDFGDTVSAGATGKWADAGHQHALAATHGSSAHSQTLSVNPHGIADHTDVTRSLWLPVNDGVVLDGGTLATIGTAPNIIRVITAADAATTGAAFAFEIPDDWATGSLTAQLYFAPSAVATTVIRFQLTAKIATAATDLTTAGTAVAWSHTLASEGVNTLVKATAQDTTLTPSGAGSDIMMIDVRRLGADGADTFTGSAHLVGLRITYTGTQ